MGKTIKVKLFLKCDCFNGSFFKSNRKTRNFSFLLSKNQGDKLFCESEITTSGKSTLLRRKTTFIGRMMTQKKVISIKRLGHSPSY